MSSWRLSRAKTAACPWARETSLVVAASPTPYLELALKFHSPIEPNQAQLKVVNSSRLTNAQGRYKEAAEKHDYGLI